MLIALGAAELEAMEENLFSRWDMLSLPSAPASDLQCVSVSGLRIPFRDVGHSVQGQVGMLGIWTTKSSPVCFYTLIDS